MAPVDSVTRLFDYNSNALRARLLSTPTVFIKISNRLILDT